VALTEGELFTGFWEAAVQYLYNDANAPYGNCTFGIGHLMHMGRCVPQDLKTLASLTGTAYDQRVPYINVVALFRQDYLQRRVHLNEQLLQYGIHLPYPQLSALTDFVYEHGDGALAMSGILAYLRGDNYTAVEYQLRNYVVYSPDRQGAESYLFRTGNYQAALAHSAGGVMPSTWRDFDWNPGWLSVCWASHPNTIPWGTC
jgi:GH24 family phage-related lysozyme (muramidase)